MMYHLAEHIEADKITYSERYKEPFQCKLCTFKSSNDQEIKDHMIKHVVENVLVSEVRKSEETTEILATIDETEEKVESENELDNDDDSEDEDLCEGFNEDGNRVLKV